jgi:hypothetical protein
MFAAPGDNPVARENKYVQVDVTLESNTVIAGTEGAILFAFTPVEGIHINADPPVEVAIGKNPEVTLQGDPDISTDKETGFLSTSSPVRQRFSVSSTATPGTYSLKGTIVYYFCSDTQGWCTKFRQRVTLKLIVARR